ncbi:MAG: TolC family protein, partial [bacterium]
MPLLRHAFSFVVLFALLRPGPGRAAEALSWPACVREARARNPDLARAAVRLAAARARRNAAFGGFLPRATASLSASDSASEKRLYFRDLDAGYAARLGVSQSVFSGFGTLADARQAAASARREEAALRREEAALRYRLRAAFVNVLFGQENITVQAGIAARRRANADLVQLKYEGGRENKGDALRARADALQAAFEEARARRALTLARQRLARELGRDEFGALEVAGEWTVAAPPAGEDLRALAEGVPATREAAASADAVAAAAWEAAAPFWPDLNANADVKRSGPDLPPDATRSWSADLTLSWNLFVGGRDWYGLAAARANRRDAVLALEAARRNARVDLQEALFGFMDAV